MKNSYILKRIFGYLKPHSGRLITAVFCMAAVAGLTALAMWMVKYVVDMVFILKDASMLVNLVLLVPIVYLFKEVLTYSQNYLMAYIGQKTIQKIRDDLFSHLVNMDISYFHANASGYLMQRITNDTQVLQNALVQIPASIIRDGLTLVCLIGLIFFMNYKFAFIIVFVFPLAGIAIVRLGIRLRKASNASQKSIANVYNNLQESFTGNAVIKAFSQEDTEILRFKTRNQEYFNDFMKYIRASVLSGPLMEYLGALAVTFLIWYGGRDVIQGVWTTGAFFAFLASAISAYKPLKSLSEVNSVIQLALTGAERIFEILDAKSKIIESPAAKDFGKFSKSIEFKNVEFYYNPGIPVLKNINLKINCGEVVAIVGPSGAGKSSLVNLLIRFFDPVSGSIEIDGHNVKDWKLNALRGNIGYVTQDVVLFNDTIAYNISYANKKATEEEVKKSARLANADEFIKNLPQGYQTIIGEKGCSLSGGQRQRIAIARAILLNPSVLIMDEATSALDSESEKLIQDALERLMKGRTVLCIAHRLSTIKKSDRIVIMDKGAIIQEGAHDILLEKSPLYKKLYELQFNM